MDDKLRNIEDTERAKKKILGLVSAMTCFKMPGLVSAMPCFTSSAPRRRTCSLLHDIYKYVCMYVCMYVCIYVCVYVCMYVYIYV